MFDPTSRYARLEEATHARADGSEVRYVTRRFCPPAERLPLLVEQTVAEGDRLDLITNRTLGDPLQFWRVADANNALSPFDLLEIGRILRIPIPQP
ncbi:MAG: hypothetical protein M9918_02840 [Anaerolineae bacterium]|nr:hypothetical protein [Anaerolineae bacterium]MCO5194770.1 hypothetical protein [Anaerolineae bacterium]